MLDALYGAWKEDTEAGKTSLMIAGDLATVGELNARAQADRIAAGQVVEGRGGGGRRRDGGGRGPGGDPPEQPAPQHREALGPQRRSMERDRHRMPTAR